MNWNWLGWLLWICGTLFLLYVVHRIRVKQLMLIAKTGRRFDGRLFATYVAHLLIALVWLGGLSYLTFWRAVPVTNHQQVTTSYSYEPLQLTAGKGGNYYYVLTNYSQGGRHPVVAYTYLTGNAKKTVSARAATVTDSDRVQTTPAAPYRWDQRRLAQEGKASGHAFAATVTVRYKNTIGNGIGLHSGRVADQYTLIRVPSQLMVQARN